MFFGQQLGGSIFVCVAQTVFLQQLKSNLRAFIPAVDLTARLMNVGATELLSIVPPELLPQVLLAYNKTIDRTFYVGMGVACVSVVPALFEWKSVKGHGGPHDNEDSENGTKAMIGISRRR